MDMTFQYMEVSWHWNKDMVMLAEAQVIHIWHVRERYTPISAIRSALCETLHSHLRLLAVEMVTFLEAGWNKYSQNGHGQCVIRQSRRTSADWERQGRRLMSMDMRPQPLLAILYIVNMLKKKDEFSVSSSTVLT